MLALKHPSKHIEQRGGCKEDCHVFWKQRRAHCTTGSGPWLFRGPEVQHSVKSQFHRDFTAENILLLQINTKELNPCIEHNEHLQNYSPKLEGGSVYPSLSETTVNNAAQQDNPHFNNVITIFPDSSLVVCI